MHTQATLVAGASRWPGWLDPAFLPSVIVDAGNRLADSAKAGDWGKVFMVLEDEKKYVMPYQWRPGGSKWFTALHQAAWHGAPAQVVTKLVKRGALRWLPDAKGRIAIDVAMERGHHQICQQLEPPEPLVSGELLQQMNAPLAELIRNRSAELAGYPEFSPAHGPDYWRRALRCPPVLILSELPKNRLWFPIPGIEGGFRITLHQGFIEVISWNDNAKGSGEAHVVTAHTTTIVDGGFI